jgi:hypothetical protein
MTYCVIIIDVIHFVQIINHPRCVICLIGIVPDIYQADWRYF